MKRWWANENKEKKRVKTIKEYPVIFITNNTAKINLKQNMQSINKETTYPKAVDGVGSSVVALEPASAEGQGAEGLVDVAQQLLGPRGLQRHVAVAEVAHIVRALSVLQHIAPPGAAERLDGVELAFLHARRVAIRHDRHGLAAVDLIRSNGVAVEVAAALDGVHSAVNRDFVRFHDLEMESTHRHIKGNKVTNEHIQSMQTEGESAAESKRKKHPSQVLNVNKCSRHYLLDGLSYFRELHVNAGHL